MHGDTLKKLSAENLNPQVTLTAWWQAKQLINLYRKVAYSPLGNQL